MFNQSLRSQVIRLAHARPEFQGVLLPLLKSTSKKVASGFSLFKDFQDARKEAWEAYEQLESQTGDSEETNAAYSVVRQFDALGMSFSKAYPEEKTFEALRNLFDKDIVTESKIHSWASRISDGNTAVRFSSAGWNIKVGRVSASRGSFFYQNWKYQEKEFIAFGALVEKATTERFWELAGRGTRVKPVAPPSAKQTFTPPAIPSNMVPMTANGWDLYESVAGSGSAAKALGKSMTVALKMVGRNVTPLNTDAKNAKNLQDIIRRMGKILNTYGEWGARDSEPGNGVIDVFEQYVGLYLDRPRFRKTYDSLSPSYL